MRRIWSACCAADGDLAPTPAAEPYLAIIDALTDAELEGFYRDMFVIRASTSRRRTCSGRASSRCGRRASARRRRRSGRPAPRAPQDHLFPSYREHVVARSAASTRSTSSGVMRGLTHGGWNPYDPKNGNTHIYTLVLGSQTLHATGWRWASPSTAAAAPAIPSATKPCIVYYGDGASSQGDVHEAWSSPRATGRPQVFFLQNNQWAISVPVATQSRVAAVQARRGLRDARASRSTATMCSPATPSRASPSTRRARRRPARDRGDDVPDGRAHHERRPDEVPHLR